MQSSIPVWSVIWPCIKFSPRLVQHQIQACHDLFCSRAWISEVTSCRDPVKSKTPTAQWPIGADPADSLTMVTAKGCPNHRLGQPLGMSMWFQSSSLLAIWESIEAYLSKNSIRLNMGISSCSLPMSQSECPQFLCMLLLYPQYEVPRPIPAKHCGSCDHQYPQVRVRIVPWWMENNTDNRPGWLLI